MTKPNERFFCQLGSCQKKRQFNRQIDLDRHQKAKHGCPFLSCKSNRDGTLFPSHNARTSHMENEHRKKVAEGEDQSEDESATEDGSSQSSQQSSSQQQAPHSQPPSSYHSETVSVVKKEGSLQPHRAQLHNTVSPERVHKHRQESESRADDTPLGTTNLNVVLENQPAENEQIKEENRRLRANIDGLLNEYRTDVQRLERVIQDRDAQIELLKGMLKNALKGD